MKPAGTWQGVVLAAGARRSVGGRAAAGGCGSPGTPEALGDVRQGQPLPHEARRERGRPSSRWASVFMVPTAVFFSFTLLSMPGVLEKPPTLTPLRPSAHPGGIEHRSGGHQAPGPAPDRGVRPTASHRGGAGACGSSQHTDQVGAVRVRRAAPCGRRELWRPTYCTIRPNCSLQKYGTGSCTAAPTPSSTFGHQRPGARAARCPSARP